MTAPDEVSGSALVDDFDAAIQPHLQVLRRLAAVTANGVDPDDVVQDALLRAWQKRSQYRSERGSVRTWLLAITADQARRARQRNPTRTWVELDANQPTDTRTAERDLDLRKAVESLSARQRQAVLLFYYADLSVDETAHLMSCATGTVKSTLADARSRLQKQVGVKDE